jgi:hypothetical protein
MAGFVVLSFGLCKEPSIIGDMHRGDMECSGRGLTEFLSCVEYDEWPEKFTQYSQSSAQDSDWAPAEYKCKHFLWGSGLQLGARTPRGHAKTCYGV